MYLPGLGVNNLPLSNSLKQEMVKRYDYQQRWVQTCVFCGNIDPTLLNKLHGSMHYKIGDITNYMD